MLLMPDSDPTNWSWFAAVAQSGYYKSLYPFWSDPASLTIHFTDQASAATKQSLTGCFLFIALFGVTFWDRTAYKDSEYQQLWSNRSTRTTAKTRIVPRDHISSPFLWPTWKPHERADVWFLLQNNKRYNYTSWGTLTLTLNASSAKKSDKAHGEYQVNGLGLGLGAVVAPGLAPQPLLRQGFNGHLMDHVVRQILWWKNRVKKTMFFRGSRKERIYFQYNNRWWRNEPSFPSKHNPHPKHTWSRLDRLLGSWLSPWYCPRSRSPAAIFLNFFRSTTYSALKQDTREALFRQV